MKKILSTRVLVKICVLTTILLVLIIYTIWGNSALMVSMVNISSDRIASAFSNFRIAQVSDLHNAEFGESNTELIELLSEHEPDIIVITGDLIDAGHTDMLFSFQYQKFLSFHCFQSLFLLVVQNEMHILVQHLMEFLHNYLECKKNLHQNLLQFLIL